MDQFREGPIRKAKREPNVGPIKIHEKKPKLRSHISLWKKIVLRKVCSKSKAKISCYPVALKTA